MLKSIFATSYTVTLCSFSLYASRCFCTHWLRLNKTYQPKKAAWFDSVLNAALISFYQRLCLFLQGFYLERLLLLFCVLVLFERNPRNRLVFLAWCKSSFDQIEGGGRPSEVPILFLLIVIFDQPEVKVLKQQQSTLIRQQYVQSPEMIPYYKSVCMNFGLWIQDSVWEYRSSSGLQLVAQKQTFVYELLCSWSG